VAQLAAAWQAEGWTPSAIVATSAWGDALHLRQIWPEAALVVYPELWATPGSLGYGFDGRLGRVPVALQRSMDRQNLLALAALVACDAAVVPTRFQRDTFPAVFQPRLRVIHEGVNTLQACPDAEASLELMDGRVLRCGDPIVSYASRTLEPLRGLRTFMAALPALLRAHSTVQVVIAGDAQGSGYGAASSHPQGHAAALLEELGPQLDPKRVHFAGWMPHAQLLRLFQLTAVHVYYTYPYTLSWSLLEAMACAAAVVGSTPGPVEEVIRHGENGLLLPFAEPGLLAARLLELLLQPQRRRALGSAARRTVLSHYSLEASSTAYLSLLEELTGRQRQAEGGSTAAARS
jgi:glycosyltransferase involved in cell wall biosynthesis